MSVQIAKEQIEVKGKGERERYTQLTVEFQRRAKRDKKSLNEQCKEIEEKIELERPEIPSRNLEISGEHFMQGFNSIQSFNCV